MPVTRLVSTSEASPFRYSGFAIDHLAMSVMLNEPAFMSQFFTLQVVSGVCVLYDFFPGVFYSVFAIFIQFLIFILPLIILVDCYGRIVWVLHRRINTNTTESQSNLGDKFLLARKNTIKTFLLVGLCFIICWIQNQVYYLIFNLGYDVNWNSPYYQYTILMIFLNCTVNPWRQASWT